MVNDTLGDRIKNCRMQMGLDRDDFSERLGYSKTTVARWERNTQQPSEYAVSDLSFIFGVSEEWLLNGANSKQSHAQ